MGLATGTAKTLLFVFNFLFFVSGILIIVMGAIVLNQQKDLEAKVEYSTFTGAPIVLIVVGVFIMFISFFGCYGAISSSYCMLMTFAALLILIFILEFAAGIAAYVKRDTVETSFKDGLKKLRDDRNTTDKDQNEAWDAIQKEWKCCGVDGFSEYYNITTYYNRTVPDSCCAPDYNRTCSDEELKSLKIKGCYDAMVGTIQDNIVLIGGIGVGIAFIQILGITLACCLGMNVKNHL